VIRLSSKLIPIDPNNINQIELIDQFQKKEGIATPIGTIKKEDKNNDNDFTIELLLEENKEIQDICHIQGVKDMRQCFISFLSKNKRKRKMIPLATSYALDVLGMEEVFIKTQPNDENMIKYLLESNYECLGDEKGSIIFLKEKNL
jgi:hypothetical protein